MGAAASVAAVSSTRPYPPIALSHKHVVPGGEMRTRRALGAPAGNDRRARLVQPRDVAMQRPRGERRGEPVRGDDAGKASHECSPPLPQRCKFPEDVYPGSEVVSDGRAASAHSDELASPARSGGQAPGEQAAPRVERSLAGQGDGDPAVPAPLHRCIGDEGAEGLARLRAGVLLHSASDECLPAPCLGHLRRPCVQPHGATLARVRCGNHRQQGFSPPASDNGKPPAPQRASRRAGAVSRCCSSELPAVERLCAGCEAPVGKSDAQTHASNAQRSSKLVPVLGRPGGSVSNPRPPDDPERVSRNERCTGFSSNPCSSLGCDKRLPATPCDAKDAELHDALGTRPVCTACASHRDALPPATHALQGAKTEEAGSSSFTKRAPR